MNKSILFILLCASVLISCKEGGGGDSDSSKTYVVIGSLTGLYSGNIVLQNNAGDSLSVSRNGTFAFTAQLEVDESYDVAIISTPEHHTCNVSDGSGVAGESHIINVKVICSYNPLLTIGLSLKGLHGGSIVLQNNLTDELSISSNGNYVFPTAMLTGDEYSISVFSAPEYHTCVVSNGVGTVGDVSVTNIGVNCVSTAPYPNNPVYTEAVRTTYRCETGRGNIFFEFAYAAGDLLAYYPVGSKNSTTECRNKSLLGSGNVSGTSSCVFFDSSSPGRWSLSYSNANLLTEVPAVLTKRLAVSNDCENNVLQNGVTVSECSKEYTCYRESTLPSTYFEPIDKAMSTAYQCDTPHGRAFFGLNYFSHSEGARFSPIQDSKEDCTDLSTFPKGSLVAENSARCLFYSRKLPWDFIIPNMFSMETFPNQVTTPLANFYCRDGNLADGVSIEQCKDDYLCNKIDLNKVYPTPIIDESSFPDITNKYQELFELINSTYTCHTQKGKAYFEFAYVAGENVYFYPLGDNRNNNKSCSDTQLIGSSTVSGRQSCLFFGETGGGESSRWSLPIGKFISKTKFPNSVVANIASDNDCEGNILQSSVAMNECKAAYRCDIQKNTKANHLAVAKEIYKTGYKCGTPRGDVYFGFSYMMNDRLSFYPVGSDSYSKTDCLDRNLLKRDGTVSNNSKKCVFFEDRNGKYDLNINNASNLASLPETVVGPIASSYYCNKDGSLQSGVTKTMCNADYTCTKVEL